MSVSMEVQEHFYSDDPSRGPVDGRTTLGGVDYFFLGNGLIQAAVQVTSAEGATPVGLLVMDPERLGPKRAALTFDSGSGIGATALSLIAAGAVRSASGGSVRARWLPGAADPRVEIGWRSGPYRVTELFFCPDMGSARLLRRVTVTRTADGGSSVRLRTGVGNKIVEASFAFRGVGTKTAVFAYALSKSGGRSAVRISLAAPSDIEPKSDGYWKDTAICRFSDPLLDRFFAASKFQLRAAVSSSGRLDGSIWQYNLEWVRDQALIALALTMSGQSGPARTILDRLLSEFVSDEGATMDSSRLRAWQESEFDQNGVLLFALESYANWTGDRDLVLERWDKIEKAADFPLRRRFRHGPSGLLVNRREFWERHEAHGVRMGMELAHQLFVAMGLQSAGRMARLAGRTGKADAWAAAAARLREATLRDAKYSLVEAGTFIKRRGVAGDVQEEIRPLPDSSLPRQAPLFEAGRHLLDPDSSAALPLAWEFIDPAGRLARRTLASMETLWNQRWKGGGYGRYHVSSEPDSPGPWPFPSLFIARAAFEAGDDASTRRVLDWLGRVPGARAAAWFEFYGPRPVPPYPQVGIIPWTWAELVFLFVHHMAGVRPGADALRLRPRLLRGLTRMDVDLPLRGGRLELAVRKARRGEEPGYKVGSRKIPFHPYGLGLELPDKFDRIVVRGILP
jgi:hypothetical protein